MLRPRNHIVPAVIMTAAIASAAFGQYGQKPKSQPNPSPTATAPPASTPKDTTTPSQDPPRPTVPPADPAWLERIDKDDRAALDGLLGYAPPAMPADLRWIGSAPANWNDLRGRVVVIQSFTTANSRGASFPARLNKSLGEIDKKDLFIIALHTPDGADKAEAFLAKKPAGVPVLLDADGAFCDSLNIYKDPVNVVVDRNGAVRYVALNDKGLAGAVEVLSKEKFDLNKSAQPRPAAAASDSAEFPPLEVTRLSALNFINKPAPNFYVQKWITPGGQPEISNRVVVVDFWATWCGPCRAAIPHMNKLAEKFADKATFVGVSDEKENQFSEGMKDRKLSLDSFKYSLALDSSAKMKSTLKVSGIPHIMIVSSDGIVRWQGHPSDLTLPVMEQIIKADDALKASGAGGKATPKSKSRPKWTS